MQIKLYEFELNIKTLENYKKLSNDEQEKIESLKDVDYTFFTKKGNLCSEKILNFLYLYQLSLSRCINEKTDLKNIMIETLENILKQLILKIALKYQWNFTTTYELNNGSLRQFEQSVCIVGRFTQVIGAKKYFKFNIIDTTNELYIEIPKELYKTVFNYNLCNHRKLKRLSNQLRRFVNLLNVNEYKF